MNQTEIGKFIAKCRKDIKLTQAQLAEKLNITDRTFQAGNMKSHARLIYNVRAMRDTWNYCR